VAETEGFIRALGLLAPAVDEPARDGAYPWQLPVVRALHGDGLALHPRVTYLVGENGSGKSTLLEALAVAVGINPEGGSSGYAFSTRESHSLLGEALRVVRGARRWGTDFFLRAESLFTTATYLESLPMSPLAGYGGVSLHEQSHGESFLAVMLHRFGPNGLYLLDEPEAALSPQNCLTCLRRIHELVSEGCQLVIATHSPLVLAYPDALIYELAADGPPAVIAYEQAEPVRLTETFLADRERFLATLLAD
jgi:predicted ATPase